MLKWFACTAAPHQFAQRRKLRFTQPALEVQIQLHPFPAQYVSQQVLRVQTWTVDVALLEIARCRLQDLEHSHVATVAQIRRRTQPLCISSNSTATPSRG